VINDDVIQKIVVETNSFAAQEMFSKSDVSLHACIKKWFDTDPYEIEEFFSLLIWSRLVSLPSYK